MFSERKHDIPIECLVLLNISLHDREINKKQATIEQLIKTKN